MKRLKSQDTLQNYLDGLLQDVPAAAPLPEEELPVAVKERSQAPLTLPTLTSPQARVLPLVEDVPVKAAEKAGELEVVVVMPATETGKPAWSERPFECLLFEVAGLKLAVPLVSLGSIYPLEEEHITPIFAQPEWFVGIIRTSVGNVKVLDTARWVMPERYKEQMRNEFKYVISISGYDWGLAVNEVHESIVLHPDAVKWRKNRGQRTWLAGTVIEHMCALLDVEALAELVTQTKLTDGRG